LSNPTNCSRYHPGESYGGQHNGWAAALFSEALVQFDQTIIKYSAILWWGFERRDTGFAASEQSRAIVLQGIELKHISSTD